MGPTAKAGLLCAMAALMLAGQLLERELASKRKAAAEERKRTPQPYAALLVPLVPGALPRPPRPEAGAPRAFTLAPAAPAAVAPDAEIAYVVQQGDTLAKIARRFFGTEGALELIEKRNRKTLPDPAKLQVGMTLHIPSRERSPSR